LLVYIRYPFLKKSNRKFFQKKTKWNQEKKLLSESDETNNIYSFILQVTKTSDVFYAKEVVTTLISPKKTIQPIL